MVSHNETKKTTKQRFEAPAIEIEAQKDSI